MAHRQDGQAEEPFSLCPHVEQAENKHCPPALWRILPHMPRESSPIVRIWAAASMLQRMGM